MSDVRENCVSTKGKLAGENVREMRSVRLLAATSTAVGLALLAMSLALVVSGQSQAGSSSTPPQAAGQSSAPSSSQSPAQTKGQASSQSEPQMQDQSAPPEESLAEAARKAKAQKTKSATGKVYTEEKLAGLSGRGVSSVGPGSNGDASSSSGDSNANSGAPAAGKSDEQYWRGRAQAIRDQMAGLDRQIAGIEEDIKAKGAVTVDPMSGVQAGVIYVEDRNAQIKQIEGQKAKLQDQLEALAEEGRKAGADSGWFR
ncbi:MAG TPA: hypothetical protein VN861_10440 [Candidatus Acidoferrales bacterium]|nr:hypothetical protein [Candidatus Acidoferrales bacterium]